MKINENLSPLLSTFYQTVSVWGNGVVTYPERLCVFDSLTVKILYKTRLCLLSLAELPRHDEPASEGDLFAVGICWARCLLRSAQVPSHYTLGTSGNRFPKYWTAPLNRGKIKQESALSPAFPVLRALHISRRNVLKTELLPRTGEAGTFQTNCFRGASVSHVFCEKWKDKKDNAAPCNVLQVSFAENGNTVFLSTGTCV